MYKESRCSHKTKKKRRSELRNIHRHEFSNTPTQYVGLYQLQLGYKVFAYSVKLQCEIYVLNRLQEFASRVQRLSGRNWDFQLSTVLQREWDSTLQKAFGSSSAQQDSESLSGSHAGDPPKRGNSGPGVPGGENTSQMDDRRRTVIVTEVQADEVMSRT